MEAERPDREIWASRDEIVALLEACDAPLESAAVSAYSLADQIFLRQLSRSQEPGQYVLAERRLVDQSQVPSGKDRRDLVEILAALVDEPETSPVLAVVLAAEVHRERLADLGVTVLHHDEEVTVAVVCCEGNRPWPEVLGGPGRSGEIERRFTLVARRAPWRDRQLRRLARVVVDSVEIHRDPSPPAP